MKNNSELINELNKRQELENREIYNKKELCEEYVIIPRAEDKEYYPMLSAQNRIFQKYEVLDECTGYNMLVSIKIKGEVNVDDVRKAIQKLIERHEILRTAFLTVNGESVQKIIDYVDADFEYIQDLETDEIDLLSSCIKPFNLEEPPLVRVCLIDRGEYHILNIDMHRIIGDSTSMMKFIEEFYYLYNGCELKKLTHQFKDYSEWMRTRDLSFQEVYWKKEFNDEIPVLDIPLDYVRPRKQCYSDSKVCLRTGKKLGGMIRKISMDNDATEFMVFCSALMVLLSKYSRQEDIVVGTHVNCNAYRDTEDVIGLFTDKVALKGKTTGNMTYNKFLENVKETCLKAFKNQEYPFDELVELVDGKRDASRHPIFDVMINLCNNDCKNADLKGMEIEWMVEKDENVGLDLSFDIVKYDDEFEIQLRYCTELFKKENVEMILKHFVTVLQEITKKPSMKIDEIVVVNEEEKRILMDFNTTNVEYPKDKTIVELFEEKVKSTPNRKAVVFEGQELTFVQLNEKANQLARKLREAGVKPNDYVGMITERSIEMVIGVFGILKAGGAYVPIDPTFSNERIRFMLTDCSPKAVLVYKTDINDDILTDIRVFDLEKADLFDGDVSNVNTVNCVDDKVYCIYTSGTTGTPKGVEIGNVGIVGLIKSYETVFRMNEDDRMLQYANYCFDQSVADIFGTILNGATLYVVSTELRYDIEALEDYICDNEITVISLTPKIIREMYPAKLKKVRVVDSGGEEGELSVLKDWAKAGKTVINSYGPTEATVNATYEVVTEDTEKLTIGRNACYAKIYIVNKGMLCGIGMPGEICIAGDGIAMGYLNREDLTAEKFVSNPYGKGRMYYTGDLARWLPDGTIEYLGRIDEQVKIRGFRIELGEIESCIRAISGVSDCAVIAREDGDSEKAIYAYYSGEGISISEIRDKLSEVLPNYMIPTYMMKIESIPKTRNGKLDKKALPDIEVKASKEYLAPRNETESALCCLYEDVLKITRIGIDDNFFELGGHSLKAIYLINSIRNILHKSISIAELFKYPTVSGLSRLLENKEKIFEQDTLKKTNKKKCLMSSAQRNIYIAQMKDKEVALYNIIECYKIEGEVELARLKSAVEKLVYNNEILRTSFGYEVNDFYQFIHDYVDVDIEYEENLEIDIEAAYMEYARPFDLGKAPLFRIKVVSVDSGMYLLLDIHHIISDGTGDELFKHMLLDEYHGKTVIPEFQFKDYSEWERGRDYSVQREYWNDKLRDLPERLNLPFRGKRTKIRGYKGGSISKKIENDLIDKIKQFCLINNCSEFMFLLSVYMILLHKYSKQDDILVGTPIAGRTIKGTERMLGMFVNTVVLRGNPEEKKNYMDFLTEIRKMVFDSLENQDYPFDKLAVDLKEKQDVSINDIVDVMFIVQNTEKLQEQNTGLKLIDVNMPEIVSKYDITLEILDNYEIVCEYSYDLFDIDTAKRILLHYIELLKQILNNPNSEIEKLSVISEEEKNTILYTFNRDYAVKREECGIVNAFLDIAKRYPSALAVIEESECITYQELDEYSSAFASELVKRGVKRNEYVALILDKGIETVIGIMGILKAGAVYVPIDHNLPLERIRYILNDCKAKIAVYKEENEIKELLLDMKIVCLSTTRGKITENIVQFEKYSHNDLAYLIYTSGTTGNPKGVMIREEGLLYLCRDFIERFNLKPDVRVLQHTNISFDPFIEEVFPVLLSGATVVVTPDNAKEDYNLLCDYMYNKNVDIADFCPLVLAELLPYLERKHCVKQIICGGDNLSAFLKTAILQLDIELFNNYGPSEITVDATCYECTDDPRNIIGKPFGDKKIYIMNGNQLCGIGVPGEICITGKGLAVGYLNLPELTAEKFVNNPFGEGRMYRSGDLARWLPDGNIEYMGRIDEQIKIRGHRIELGEIESRIQEIEGVKESAVIAREDRNGEKAIYAYYTGEGVGISEIRDRLSEVLPNYMVPAYMMEIESIPKTRNGKLDKRMLPNIEIKLGKEYVAPENQMEKMICKIFEEILSLEKVGVEDNFFELGGHSLRATRLVNRIEAETGVRIALKDIFIQSTPRKLSDYICISSGDSYASIPMAEEKDYYPMSSAQKRIYLIQQMNPEGVMYNMPQVLKLYGNVNIDRFKAVLTEIVARHEVLRTEFLMIEGNPVQNILKEVTIPFEYVEMTDKDDNEEIKEFVRAFDLSKAPQIRVRLVKRDEYILFMLDMHHIIGDGMSIGTFLNEINSLYRGEKLPELTKQFKDYSEWMSTRNLDKQKSYWISQFEDEIPTLDMPLDYIRPKEQSFAGGTVERVLDEELAYQIKKLAFEKGVTEYMIFLSAVMIMLGKYSRQEDIVIGSPISGRTHKDTEGMLGMFVNTLAMRGKPEKSKSYSAFLNEIKEMCLKAYENQEYPFEELVETVNVQREMSRNPLFDVMLVLQNNEEAKIELKDVEAEIWNGENNAAAFDLTFEIEEDDAKYIIMLEYCTALFKKETVNYMLVHLEEILRQLTANEHIMIGDIAMASQEEQDMIKKEFNATEVQYSVEKNIVDVFEKQVSKTPNNNAVVFEERTITYKELNAKSNNLANILYNMGIQKDEYVVLLTERSIEMIIGIMGVLKAGGAYVPVDINYPEERIRYILEDCKPKAVVYYHPVREESGEIRNTVEKIRNSIAKDFRIIDLYDLKKDEDTNENLVITRAENDLAYCIYTSGTTGKPKGIGIKHCGVINLICNFMQMKYSDKILNIALVASYVFDASIQNIFAPLLAGKTLYIVSDECKAEGRKLLEFFNENKIQIADCTPIHLKLMIQDKPKDINPLEYLYVGGEALETNLAKEILKKKYCKNIINVYGPTECTVDSTYYEIDLMTEKVYIGKPIANTKVYVEDNNCLCGIGVPGELCIAGVGLARNYVNNPSLTAQKFVQNPYGEGCMYRSGDLARWLPDGNIEYLGRVDEQVKIRGFRIELGEIENRIRENGKVEDCAVIARTDVSGQKAISAYIVGKEPIEIAEIRGDLEKVLPAYMIPAYMLQIDQIPITKNGKLNKNALPEIEVKTSKEYIAPRNRKEEAIRKAFSAILNIEKIGIKDDFFELGGDSIKAIRILSILRNEGYHITVKDIMSKKNIESLSVVMTSETDKKEYEQGQVVGVVRNTPIINVYNNNRYAVPEHFNQSVMFSIDQMKNVDVYNAIAAIVKHHDILRAVYKKGHLEILSIDESSLFDFYQYDFSDKIDVKKKIEEECDAIQRSINLEKGPLVKAAIFKTENDKLLMLCIHHLVVDGVSWRIIAEDFTTAMEQINNNIEVKLPKKTVSYKEWAEAINEYGTKMHERERNYWNALIKKENVNIQYKKTNRIATEKNAYCEVSFSKELTEKVMMKSGKACGAKINEVLLSAIAKAIGKITGQKEVGINIEGHGRENLNDDIETDRTVGWFTAIYPIVLPCVEDTRKSIISAKELMRSVPNGGVGYGCLFLGQKKIAPDITFNYLGDMDEVGDNTTYDIGREIAEENRTNDKILINGMVKNKYLYFSFECFEQNFSLEFIKEFAERFKESVEEAIEFCVNAEEEKTASDYELQITDVDEFDRIKNSLNGEIEKIYELSPLQAGMLFYYLKNPESTEYVIQNTYRIESRLNGEIVKEALSLLSKKYNVLNTSIISEGLSEPLQVIYKNRMPEYLEVDIRDYDNELKEDLYLKVAKKEVERGFNLEHDSLIRVTSIKYGEQDTRLIWTMHHIIVDGWCMNTLIDQFFAYYNGLKDGINKLDYEKDIEEELEKDAEFCSYIYWLRTQDKEKAREYWKQVLLDYENVCDIPAIMEPENTIEQVHRSSVRVDKLITAKMKKCADDNSSTINTIVEVICGLLLQKWNGTNDVVFGKVVSGRNADIAGIENMVGLLINTIPARVKTESEMTIRELIVNQQKQGAESTEYDFYSLAEIQSLTDQMSNLIKVLYVFENYTSGVNEDVQDESQDISIENVREQTNYGLSIYAYEVDDELEFCIMSDSRIYNDEQVKTLLEQLVNISKEIVNNPNKKINDIEILTNKEKNLILDEFNSTNVEYPKEQTVVELFEKQVKKTPDNVAVVFEGNELSYEQLNRRANIIANKLREEGVEREDYVAIIADRSIEMIIGIYGIIKAGGTYVPIDPTYPDERIDFMLHDCQAKIVLLYGDELKINSTIQQIDLKDLEVWKGNEDNPAHINSPEDLLYCIYTSGTTGKPKGVMIQNYNVVNYSMCSRYDIMKYAYDNRLTKMVSVTNMIFDIFVTEIITTLLNGLTVYIANYDEQRELSSFEKLVTSNEIEILQTTPSRIKQMLMQGDCSNVLKSLKFIMLGGEYVSGDLVSKLKEYADVYVENVYGPSETTVWSSYYEYKDGRNRIGRPISNTQIYIVNGNSLCGVGVPGELCIAGDGLARGYLNRPELTAEKFVNNPYGEGKMYHTGDLARWMPDGNIEYLGRIDEQVKIRGHRIELGEIESRIREIKEVKECAVITKEDSSGEKAIYAYYTGGGIQVSEIRERLSEVLPEYMIPAYMREIENIPITKNGKLDKRALPDIEVKATKEYEAPQDEYQIAVINEMKSLLHVENVGLNDDFFQLGGNSIKATLAVIHLNKLGYKITIKELITLREMKKIANIIKIKDQL